MKKLYLATSLTLLLSTQAFAQDVIMDQSDLEALDKDGDGIVSKQEYKGFTRFAFTTIDADNDGALSPDEVGVFLAGDAFSILDDDRSGSVSEGEFMSQMDEDFATGDKDGDGVLN